MLKTNKLTIIAGPCSIDYENISEIYDISKIEVEDDNGKFKKAIFGTRIVGLKSRTIFINHPKNFLGIDFDFYKKEISLKSKPGKPRNIQSELPPSVKISKEVIRDTNLLVTTEIMMPQVQIPFYSGIPKDKLLFWNPAVNQLGWSIYETSQYCNKNGWYVGVKNGKWFNQDPLSENISSMEKTWQGLSTFALDPGRIVMIHRGVDYINKGLYRNVPVHQVALRTKVLTKLPLFFDPSHICGPLLRDKIVEIAVDAMKLKIDKEHYLYDGILIEVGNSKSDTNQHITINKLKSLVKILSRFRDLNPPEGAII